MNKLKSIRKIMALCMTMVLFALSCGCTIGKYTFTFKKEKKTSIVFSLGEYAECTAEEMLVYFLLEKTEYENVFGKEVWNLELADMTMQDFVENNVLSEALYRESLCAIAKDSGLELDETKVAELEASVEEVYGSIEEKGLSEKIAKGTVRDVLEVYLFSELAYDYVTADVNEEISDAEAKVIISKYIKCDFGEKTIPECKALMTEIQEALKTSKFDNVVMQYSEQIDSGTIDVCKGDFTQLTTKGSTLESVLFSMKAGDISELIATDDAYYIFESVSDYDAEKTERNKSVILEKRKNAMMEERYNSFIEGVNYKFYDEIWDTIGLSEYRDITLEGL